MKIYPNAKINIGLHVVEKRADGYHNIETVFYPIPIFDVLEINSSEKSDDYALSVLGQTIEGDAENNLIIKALRQMKEDFEIPCIEILLQKNIPTGAGLGGGSADAAFMLRGLNKLCALQLSENQLENYAARLGADCAVFIRNKAVFAKGTGNIFSPVNLSLKGFCLVVVKPEIHVSTAEAYAGITPRKPETSLLEAIQKPIEKWENIIINDFEESVFKKFPEIAKIKQQLYAFGAVYAAMSGSGSAVFGVFENEPKNLKEMFGGCFFAKMKL
ncbi:MAG: 4-(cytidine 5'-diphospho)-2-C-methyl-D-erythritol kinase [Prevotellaceae bacterium]|jgi:4-diphosphocytidyl-2-C-methyl-D-erythritol kinase|nr:4-(cytidine 5'-diphospho)-2-C-methyl-D-erythritol kinase [Prevotellaceae bacterium]